MSPIANKLSIFNNKKLFFFFFYTLALKSLEQINDDVLRYLCIFYRNTSENNKFEIRSSLYMIKQLLIKSLEEFK